MQNTIDIPAGLRLWKELDNVPMSQRFSHPDVPRTTNAVKFRSADFTQTSLEPTVSSELATGYKPEIPNGSTLPAATEDVEEQRKEETSLPRSSRKNENDIDEEIAPAKPEIRRTASVASSGSDESNLLARSDKFKAYAANLPSAVECETDFRNNEVPDVKLGLLTPLQDDTELRAASEPEYFLNGIEKTNCANCETTMYRRSKHYLNLCSKCSRCEGDPEDYCVPNALSKLTDVECENKFYEPEDFQALSNKLKCNIIVLSPYGYNKYEVTPGARCRTGMISKAIASTIVFFHQGRRNHVVKAVRLKDMRKSGFLHCKPLEFPLCAGAKKSLTLLHGIAEALALPEKERLNAVSSKFPVAERDKAIKLYNEAINRENTPTVKPNGKKPGKKTPGKPAPNKTPSKRNRKPPRPTEALPDTPSETPQAASYRKLGGSHLRVGKVYEVPRGGLFDAMPERLLGPFQAASYAEDYQAARWRADEIVPFKNQVDAAAGVQSYNLRDVSRAFASNLEGDGLMPPRFAGTVTKKVTADAILTLDETNFTEGETLIITTPNLEASKGALVFRKQPQSTLIDNQSLIAVVIPQIDTEELGPLQNVNTSKLSVGIQQSTGADSTVSAFSNKFEGAVTAVSPFSAIPGKLSYATEDHKALSCMVTSETMEIFNENYSVPASQVRTGRAFDKQSSNVLIPGTGGSRSPSATLRTGESYVIVAGSKESTSDTQYGWQIDTPQYIMEDESNVVIWELKDHPSYLRHILYGTIHYTMCPGRVTADSSTVASDDKYLQLKVEYTDGSEVVFRTIMNTAADTTETPYLIGSIEGYGIADDSQGKVIANIVFSVHDDTAASGTGLEIYRNQSALVHLEFDSINAASTYSSIVISGAKRGQTISIGLISDVEITIDPTGEIARYLVKPSVLSVDPRDVAAMFAALKGQGAHPYFLTGKGGGINYEAGSFGKKIKNFFKGVFRTIAPVLGTAGRAIGGAFGGPAGAAAGGALGDTIASLASAEHDANSLLAICDAHQFEATTFSNSAKSSITGFVFPTVDTSGTVARLVDVVKGEGVTRGPDFLKQFNVNLAGSERYTGSSCQLAFLCAAMSLSGAPVLAGIYSGEIRNIQRTKRTCTFELLPVALTAEKLATFGSDCLLVATAAGPTENGLPVEIKDCAAFGAFLKVTAGKINAPNGYPDACYRISLIW